MRKERRKRNTMGIVEFQNVSRVYKNGDHEQWALNHVNLSLEVARKNKHIDMVAALKTEE